MPAKPHILFIVLDTMRRDRLSLYGYPRQTSPELDSLAQDAAVFDRAVAAAQWTIPSHTSMFTGLYPSTHGVTQADSVVPNQYPMLAELLRQGGYHTAAFCNNPLVGVLNNGLQRGFDRFYNYASAAPFRPAEARRSRFQRELLHRFRRHVARPIGNQFARSDLLFRLSLNPVFVPLWTRLINYKGNSAHSIDDLIAYWEQHTAGGAERPLFAFLNLMGSHLPYNPPQDALDRLAPDMRRNKQAYPFMRRFNSEAARWASPTDPPLQDWEQQTLYDFYDAEIAHQDAQLGRLFAYLKQSGVLQNTLVIICADHGEGHGDHGFVGHGFVTHQELVHVPLIIRHPERFPAGGRLASTISTRRLFHTVLDVAGLQPQSEVNNAGLSLVDVAQGGADVEDNLAMSEAFPPLTFLNVIEHRNPALIPRLKLHGVRRALYAGSNKLTVIDQQVDGFFDVEADPTEVHNLAAGQSARVSTLQRQLATLVSKAELQRAVPTAANIVDDSVVEHLRALGYIE
ncbi:MAG: sulfatase [Anaerolineae bacterium]